MCLPETDSIVRMSKYPNKFLLLLCFENDSEKDVHHCYSFSAVLVLCFQTLERIVLKKKIHVPWPY